MRKPSRTTVTAIIGAAATTLIATTTVLTVLGVTKAPDAPTDADQIAAQFGVTIVWEKNLKCGDNFSAAGCFHTETPNVIYLDKREGTNWIRSVVLHELGHVMQYRLGEPLDECNADKFARSLGATWTRSC